MKKEKTKITKAKFKAKTQIMLGTGASENFNNFQMIIKFESIIVIQKN